MQKKTPDYDNVFKTMKSKHKRLFISVINDVFGKEYPLDTKCEAVRNMGYRTCDDSHAEIFRNLCQTDGKNSEDYENYFYISGRAGSKL